jgi:hypothetical protein
VVGAPVIKPSGARDNPGGNVPGGTENVGAGEPSADTDRVLESPTVNEPNEPNTTVGTPFTGSTLPTKRADTGEPTEFDALMVTSKGPVVAWPVIVPVFELSVNPGGNVPAVIENVDAGEPSVDSEMETSLVADTDPVLDKAVGAPGLATVPMKRANAEPVEFDASTVKS